MSKEIESPPEPEDIDNFFKDYLLDFAEATLNFGIGGAALLKQEDLLAKSSYFRSKGMIFEADLFLEMAQAFGDIGGNLKEQGLSKEPPPESPN